MDDSHNHERSIDTGDVTGANVNVGGTQIFHGDLNIHHGSTPAQPPISKPIRVFLSYARADDEPFVKRLYEYLTADGFEVWWDREKMPSRGLSFLPEIRDAIAASDRLALVIGPGAIKSDYVRAEWEYALSACIPVTPLLRLTDGSEKLYAIIPAMLSSLHCPDCRETRPETDAFAEIVRVLREPAALLGALHGVPALPEWYIIRAADLKGLADSVCADSAAPVVISSKRHTVTLRGMAGIGKTTLANALARECDIQRTFPDGVVWLELGQTPSVVTRMADIGVIFGDSRDNYPDEKSGQVRLGQLLQHRRALLILDDVWERQHAEPFRVAGARCRLLITTRSSQIAALTGVTNCALDVLDADEGAALIRKRLGLEVDADADYPHKAIHRQIVEALGGHTLALSIAAARLYQKGADYAPNLLVRLEKQRDGDTPFKDLAMNDRQFDLEKSLELSYEALSDDLKRRYRALGAFAADGTFGIAMAAGVWNDADPDDAEDALDELVGAALLSDEGNGRYAQHNLLRGYALALAQREGEAETLHALHFAVYSAVYDDENKNIDARNYPAITRNFENIQHALRWGLENTTQAAVEWTMALENYLNSQASHSMRHKLFTDAYEAAEHNGYTRGQANTLRALGDLSMRRDALSEALTYYERALTLFEAIDARLGQANTLKALGDLSMRRDALSEALTYYERALTLFEAVDERLGQANTLMSLGDLSMRRAALSEALTYYERALTLFEAVDERLGQANTLKALGDLSMRRAALSEALTYYERALTLFEAVDERLGQANTLGALGDLSMRRAALSEALTYYERALTLFEAVDERLGQANTLRALGDLSMRRAALSEALTYYERALTLFEAIDARLGQANTLRALGDLSMRRAALSEALTYYERALTLFEAVDERLGQANTLMSLGDMLLGQQRWADAVRYYEQALPLTQQIASQLGQANILIDLGRARFELGDQESGIRDVREALAIYIAIEDERWINISRKRLADLLERARRHDEAQVLRVQLPTEQPTQSTLPQDTINTLTVNTAAVKTSAGAQFDEWRTVLQSFRDSSTTRGDDWLPEVAFADALLAVLDDQPASLPDSNPYQSAVQKVIEAIADYHKGA